MDDNARRRRQNETPLSSSSSAGVNPRFTGHDPNAAQRRSYGTGSGGASDRYRPAPLNTSPTAARGMGGTAGYSGYYQDSSAAFSAAIPQNTMPYQSEYGQDTRQTQNFGPYNPNMMYSVPQTGAQSNVYDATQQFPARQPAALQMMSAADVAAPYFSSEATNTAAASALQAQPASSGSASVYQQSPADQRATLLQNYPSGMAQMGGMAQPGASDQVMDDQQHPHQHQQQQQHQQHQQHQQQGQSQSGQQQQQDYTESAEMGEAYQQYAAALKEIFTNIRNGALETASQSLLNISDWLLTKVVELGLAGDNPSLHSERIKLWHEFNYAWLAALQKQKDMVESGIPPQRGQSLITEDGLQNMGKELTRLCDGIERHGLIDYEYGVWEEKIIESIVECLDLYENTEEGVPIHATGPSHGHR